MNHNQNILLHSTFKFSQYTQSFQQQSQTNHLIATIRTLQTSHAIKTCKFMKQRKTCTLHLPDVTCTIHPSLSHLVCSSPILLRLKHSLPNHRHYFRVVLICEGIFWDFSHKAAVGSPCVIIGRFPHLCLHFGVVHDHIGPARGGGQ